MTDSEKQERVMKIKNSLRSFLCGLLGGHKDIYIKDPEKDGVVSLYRSECARCGKVFSDTKLGIKDTSTLVRGQLLWYKSQRVASNLICTTTHYKWRPKPKRYFRLTINPRTVLTVILGVGSWIRRWEFVEHPIKVRDEETSQSPQDND